MSTTLHTDIYTCFYHWLNSRDSAVLANSCKLAWNTYQTRKDPSTMAGKYRLKPGQQYTVKLMNEGNNIVLSAPMSWGKTAAGLACALKNYQPGSVRNTDPWIIMVPSKAIETWKNEAIKMYGPSIFLAKNVYSPIIVPSSDISKVHNIVNQLSNISPYTHVVIISGSKTDDGL